MEGFELGSSKEGTNGPGAGAAGAVLVLLVLSSVVYVATRSIVTTATVSAGIVLCVLLFDRLYERYVL